MDAIRIATLVFLTLAPLIALLDWAYRRCF